MKSTSHDFTIENQESFSGKYTKPELIAESQNCDEASASVSMMCDDPDDGCSTARWS